MRKVKVIHYIPGFNIGGIESRLLDWYRNIDREKIEFIVIKLNDNDESDKAKEFIRLGGKFCNLPAFNLKNLYKYFKKLKKTLLIEKPDILHVHSLSTGIFALIIAKKMNIKTRILHSRTTDYLPNEKSKFIKKILKSITPIFATDFFACSYEAGVWGNGKKNAKRTEVIKNGIDLPYFYYSDKNRNKIREELSINNKIVIGTIGRLSQQKNLLFLIDVFNEINKQDLKKEYVLIIIGEGNMLEELNKKINELNLQNYVKILGSKNDVWNYYMSFDLFISTSFYEGFGTTAIESQATGLPTILSNGFPESVVISDYVKRLSLELSPEKWADEIMNIERRQRSINDAQNVESKGYSAKAVAKNLEKFYCNRSDSI